MDQNKQLMYHSNSILAITISSDSTKLASSSYDLTIKIWSLNENQLLADIDLQQYSHGVICLKFSQNGNQLVSGGWGIKQVYIWDISNYQHIPNPIGLKDNDSFVWSLTYSLDEQYLLQANDNGSINVWSTKSYDKVNVLNYDNPIHTISLVEGKPYYILVGDKKGFLIFLNFLNGHHIKWKLETQFNQIINVASPFIILTCSKNNYKIKYRNKNRLIRVMKQHTQKVWMMDLVDNNLLSSGYDNYIKKWDLQTGQLLNEIKIEDCSDSYWPLGIMSKDAKNIIYSENSIINIKSI